MSDKVLCDLLIVSRPSSTTHHSSILLIVRALVLLQVGNVSLSELEYHLCGLEELVLLTAHLLQALNATQQCLE